MKDGLVGFDSLNRRDLAPLGRRCAVEVDAMGVGLSNVNIILGVSVVYLVYLKNLKFVN